MADGVLEPADVPTVDVNGLATRYETRGEGQPIDLILGLALDLSEAEPIVAGLAEHFRVLAHDNRGAGGTASPAGPYSDAATPPSTAANDASGPVGPSRAAPIKNPSAATALPRAGAHCGTK